MAKDQEQREDADVENEDENKPDEDDLDAVAKKAAKKIANKDGGKNDDNDEEEDLATDEEVRDWLESIVETPEIQNIIRVAARQIAKESTDKSVADVREQLEADFEKRLARIETQFRAGTIDKDEAQTKAEQAAAAAASRAKRDNGEDDPEDDKEAKERERKTAERERRTQLREVELYKKEALLGDKDKMIKELVVVREGTTEDDVDEMIDEAKTAYRRVRRSIIAELRQQGWKSPQDLRSLAEEDDPDEPDNEAPDEEEGPPGPPTRDRRGEHLSQTRKKSLRDRFKYGDRAGTGAR